MEGGRDPSCQESAQNLAKEESASAGRSRVEKAPERAGLGSV